MIYYDNLYTIVRKYNYKIECKLVRQNNYKNYTHKNINIIERPN